MPNTEDLTGNVQKILKVENLINPKLKGEQKLQNRKVPQIRISVENLLIFSILVTLYKLCHDKATVRISFLSSGTNNETSTPPLAQMMSIIKVGPLTSEN